MSLRTMALKPAALLGVGLFFVQPHSVGIAEN